MRFFHVLTVALVVFSCSRKERSHQFSSVLIETVFKDSVSIRAIEFLDDRTLAFAGSNGIYGTVNVNSGKVRTNIQTHDSITPEFRAVAHTSSDFFMLSIGSPALLYKTGSNGQMELVYKEEGDGVFYDAMKFWNDLEGIAIGDGLDGCLVILLTRDGGKNWSRVTCDELPKLTGDVGAYAASNTNIAIKGDKVWVITTTEEILTSSDRGHTWKRVKTPIVIKETYQGIYSIDFYDEELGFGIGGDFSKSELNEYNKISTMDGGQTWQLVADGENPGYKSCVQFVPNSGGADLVAVGFTGISYSNDHGNSWETLSDEGFYTLRFLNDTIAFAAGKNRIVELQFK